MTGTDYCNTKVSNKKDIHLLTLIFQKNHSPDVVFWKDFEFALKVEYGKLLKVKPNSPFSIIKKKDIGLTFWAKNVLTVLKRITDNA